MVFMAVSMLASHSKTMDTTPELLGIVGIDGLVQLSQIYGGRSIYIPSPMQLGMALKAAMAGYLRYHDRLSWDEIAARLDLTAPRMSQVKAMLKEWEAFLDARGVDLALLFAALRQSVPEVSDG